jgi:hypothetical protein
MGQEIRINGEVIPLPPYHEGTVVGFEADRMIHLRTQQEARDLSAAAAFIADNWED